MVDWCGFVRKVTFHKAKATKDMEANMLPSYTALTKHINRATYVLKLIFSVCHILSPDLKNFYKYGWLQGSNNVSIDWDDEGVVESLFTNSLSCSCKKGCKTKRCKCSSSNVNCNIRCKCDGCLNNLNSTSVPF